MLENTGSHAQPNTSNLRPKNRLANAFFLLIAGGRFRAYSLLKHIGRKSGREYRTPITAFPLGDGFVLALLYGQANEVDWVRNVMTAGTCVLKTRGVEYQLVNPEIISAAQALPAFPLLFKSYYQTRAVNQFLWVHLAC